MKGWLLNESDLGKLKMIFWRNNILGFNPVLKTHGLLGQRKVDVTGTWFNKKLTLETGETIYTGLSKTRPWVRVKGRWPRPKTKEAAVGGRLARNLRLQLNENQPLTLPSGNTSVKIVGIVSGDGAENSTVFAPLDMLQHQLDLSGKMQTIEVSALTTPDNELARKHQEDPDSLESSEWEDWYCTAFVDSIGFQVEEAIPGSIAKPVRRVAQSEGALLSKIQLLMVLLTIAALVSSGLGLSGLMTAMVLDRRKEIGLSKALGASGRTVASFFLAEAMVVGLIGGALGFSLGWFFTDALTKTIFQDAATFKPAVLPLSMALSVLIALGGSASAAAFVLKLSPKEVLHGV